MIHVPRTPFENLPKEIQEYLDTNAAEAKKFYSLPAKTRAQKRFPFADPDKNPILKDFLLKEFHGKCAYSEEKFYSKETVIIRHRPPVDTVDDLSSRDITGDSSDTLEVHRDHYWWLAFEWQNLIPVSQKIARLKGSVFPVKTRRAHIGASIETLDAIENPLIPNPSFPFTKPPFYGERDGTLLPSNPADSKLINLLDLNSQSLIESRRTVFTSSDGRIKDRPNDPSLSDIIQILEEFPYHPLEFSSLCFQEIFKIALHQLGKKELPKTKLDELITALEPHFRPYCSLKSFAPDFEPLDLGIRVTSQEASRQKAPTFIPLTITHLHIHNFKGIYSLKIPFPQDEHLEKNEAPSGLMVLGENGSGKSTILQAITLALADPQNVADIPFLKPGKILRRGTQSGFVRLTLLDQPEPLEVRFHKGSSKYQFSGPRDSLHFFFRAYGAHRLLPRYNDDSPLPENPNPISFLNLWDPYESLIDAEKWILAQPQAFFDIFARSLKDLLNLGDDGRIYRKGKQLHFDIGQRDLALDELSAGYQSVIATATDIIASYPIQGLDMQSGTGVVLIDEIGAHLHPSWRMRIVHAYRRTFPKIQFICTTHEPLCLRGVRQNELLVLEKQHKTIRPIEDLPDLEGMRIDQILTSPIFGLNTTIDPEVEAKFQEYYLLLQIESPTVAQQKRSDELRTHLYRYGILGASRRAQAIYDIIDNDLSLQSTTRSKSKISPETRKKVLEIWNESQFQNLS
jgi:energy-coupling factor transporter ATP-binding protein EcfA2